MNLRAVKPFAWFALGLAVAGSSGTAFAANGGYIKIGTANSETKITTLTNTRGTALKLVSPNSKAPLSVGTNRTKVLNLNADLIDGLDSSLFIRTPSAKFQPAGKLGTGWARISSGGIVSASSGSVSVEIDRFNAIYCVKFAGVTNASSLGSVIAPSYNKGYLVFAERDATNPNCPSSSFEVRTGDYDGYNGKYAYPEAFSIVIGS